MANKYGHFSEPSYVSIGDPYVKKVQENSRNTGLNLKAAVCKTGLNNDALFTKFEPLYVGEKYQQSYEEKRAARQDAAKQRASEAPFKPSNPQKKSSGVGNYYGCIGGKVPNMKEHEAAQKKKGDYEVGPRNIVTNPSKLGTYGFRGTTLGEKGSAGGAVGEYSYMPSAYDAARQKEVRDLKQSIEMRVTDKPFKPVSPPKKGGAGVPGRTLDGKGNGVCGEYEYKIHGPTKKEPQEQLEKPFRPSNPPKEGYNCTMNKFPHYIEDPLDLKLKKEREARRAEMTRMDAQPKFIPSSTLKSGATASILRKNIA